MTRYGSAVAWARLVGKPGIERAGDLGLVDSTGVLADHWAGRSVRFLAERGTVPVLPFSDVDPLHWAAAPVWALSPDAAGDGTRYLLYGGDRSLLRREYMYVVHRTIAAVTGEGVTRLGSEPVEPETLVVDEGLFISHPRTHELRPQQPMTRWEFALATRRVLEWPGFPDRLVAR
jgi:hypothetical protein